MRAPQSDGRGRRYLAQTAKRGVTEGRYSTSCGRRPVRFGHISQPQGPCEGVRMLPRHRWSWLSYIRSRGGRRGHQRAIDSGANPLQSTQVLFVSSLSTKKKIWQRHFEVGSQSFPCRGISLVLGGGGRKYAYSRFPQCPRLGTVL
jgi:hypothetical protein